MKKIIIATCLTVACTLAATAAMADSIKDRFGVTGRLGFISPSDSDNVSTDTGFIGGGGAIYGVTDNVAVDLDITYATYGSTPGIDFNTTDIALGGQYRFTNLPHRQLVPFAGGGIDILVNGIGNRNLDVDTVVGMHLKGGVDYFLTKQLAATTEMKGIIAPDADIHDATGAKVGNFDPMSFSMTFGVRYFFN